MRHGDVEPVYRSRALARVVACVAFLMGCTGGSSMGPSPVPKEIRPNWVAGQTWKVEFLWAFPSTEMGPVTENPPPQRSVWIYEVQKPSSEREPPTVIAVREDGGDRRYELRFDPADLSLRSVMRVVGGQGEKAGVPAPHQPYFGWSQSQPCIFDWPLFSKGGMPAKLPFRGESGALVEQSAVAKGDGAVEVVLTCASTTRRETTRSRQTWTPGQPWWTSASIEIEYVENGGRETAVEIRGNRLP